MRKWFGEFCDALAGQWMGHGFRIALIALSTLLVACALGACVAAATQRHALAGLLAGAAILARPDAGVLALLLAWRMWRTRRERLAHYLACAALAVIPWFTFALCKFGSVFPNTLAIKLAQRRLFKDPPIFLHGAWRELQAIDERVMGVGPSALFLLFVFAGLVLARRALVHTAIALYAAFAAAQFAAYTAFDLPPYHWYYTPALFAAALAVAVLFARLWRRQRPLPMLVGLALATTLLATALPELVAPEPTRVHYRQAGHWLATHTPATASIALCDIGIVGYHALPRRIIDMQGLVTAGAAEAIARGDTGWWFDHHRPDYIVLHTVPWADFEQPVVERAEFRRDYRRIVGSGLKGLEVFERVPAPR